MEGGVPGDATPQRTLATPTLDPSVKFIPMKIGDDSTQDAADAYKAIYFSTAAKWSGETFGGPGVPGL